MIDAPTLPELVLEHREILLRLFRAHGWAEQADDLFQELWLKARRPTAPTDVSRGYVMRMAQNLIVDHARSARQRGLRDDRWHTDGPSGGDVDPVPDAMRTLIARQRLDEVQKVLRDLGPRTERILRLHRLDGRSQKQIASEERLSLSAVEKHLQKAYRAIASVRLRTQEGH